MMAITQCQRVSRRLGPFLDGELPPDETRRIEAHLDDCARCRETLLSIREHDSLLAGSDFIEDPGQDYWRDFLPRLRGRIAAAAGGEKVPAPPPRPRWMLTPWSGIIGAVAVAVLAVLIFHANETLLSPPGLRSSKSVSTGPRDARELNKVNDADRSLRLGAPASPAPGSVSERRPEHGAVRGGANGSAGIAVPAPDLGVSKEAGRAQEIALPEPAPEAAAGPARSTEPGALGGLKSEEAGFEEAGSGVSAPGPAAEVMREASAARREPEALRSAPAKGLVQQEVQIQAGETRKRRTTESDWAMANDAPSNLRLLMSLDELAVEAMDQVSKLETEAAKAGVAPNYARVLPLLESLEPAALHPESSGLPDSLATGVLAALERARPKKSE